MFPNFGMPMSYRSMQKLMELNLGIAMAANEVILRRTMMMMSGSMSGTEATRMMLEKPATMMKSAGAAAEAAISGKSAGLVAEAALGPYRAKTKANARRLRG